MDIKQFKQNAFSLIELMVAVAIIGILSAIVIPSYNTYTLKSKTSELIGYANNLGIMVGNYVSEIQPTTLTGACTSMPNLSGNPNTNITNNWTIDANCLVQVFSKSIYPGSTAITIRLTPALSSGDGYVSWTCSSNNSPYAPTNCQ